MDIQVIYLDIQVNTVIRLQEESKTVPPFPPPRTFLILISQKILLNIKDIAFDFRMGCILALFLFLRIINVQFKNFGFFYFQNEQYWLTLLYCITLPTLLYYTTYSIVFLIQNKKIIIEISLNLHLHTKYERNNPNSGRLDQKSSKFNFLPFIAAQKFIVHTNIQIHVNGLNFHHNFF